MTLLQVTSADIIVWRDILLPIFYVGGVIYGSIILTKQVAALKEQVNSQKEIIDRTKTYFEIFDLNKIKEYAKLTEENAQLKTDKVLEELNKKIEEKEQRANELEEKHSILLTSNQKLEEELYTRRQKMENALSEMGRRMLEVELRSTFPEFYAITPYSNWQQDTGGRFGKDVQSLVCQFIDETFPNEDNVLTPVIDQNNRLFNYVKDRNEFFADCYNKDSKNLERALVQRVYFQKLTQWAADYLKIRKFLKEQSI
ncbi:hypothetical protein [Hymenobacter glacieicola]|uniref:DUF4041 domain-containing protein n=1 Tax=Hymenobacter glacieicola TaxID=1562124 RepID=A0ABQ1WJA3_9BACT|nr:hypothetical protein [Hymenobacter glacieicola]GGG33847.1 hypothetical protein GCM10011378_07890 [Hymenobacter glacieicola]